MKYINTTYDKVFKEFQKIDSTTSEIYHYNKVEKKKRQIEIKNKLEDRLHSYLNEIRELDFNQINNKLIDLEVDNLFGQQEASLSEDNRIKGKVNSQRNNQSISVFLNSKDDINEVDNALFNKDVKKSQSFGVHINNINNANNEEIFNFMNALCNDNL